jgi:AhpD family alkylhydroperoxidase
MLKSFLLIKNNKKSIYIRIIETKINLGLDFAFFIMVNILNVRRTTVKERMTYKDMPEFVFNSLMNMEQNIQSSSIDKKLLHLIKLYASQINGCAFCVDMHFKNAQKDGLDVHELINVQNWRETPYFDEKERAVLLWTETLTNISNEQVPSHVYEEVRAYFSNSEIGELSLAVIGINSWNRLVLSIGTVAGTYNV